MDHVKLHFCGNSRQRKQTCGCLKGLHTCKIHTNITTVIQEISLSSFTIFFANFYVVIFIIIISNFRSFASDR